jgi:hypothetical protein
MLATTSSGSAWTETTGTVRAERHCLLLSRHCCLWYVKACTLVESREHNGGKVCLHLQGAVNWKVLQKRLSDVQWSHQSTYSYCLYSHIVRFCVLNFWRLTPKRNHNAKAIFPKHNSTPCGMCRADNKGRQIFGVKT